MKQLNFRHFNTNRKKFTVTVNFGQKETKTAPKGQYYFVWYTKKSSIGNGGSDAVLQTAPEKAATPYTTIQIFSSSAAQEITK